MDFCSFRSLDQSKVTVVEIDYRTSTNTPLVAEESFATLSCIPAARGLVRLLLPLIGAFGHGSKLQASPLVGLGSTPPLALPLVPTSCCILFLA